MSQDGTSISFSIFIFININVGKLSSHKRGDENRWREISISIFLMSSELYTKYHMVMKYQKLF